LETNVLKIVSSSNLLLSEKFLFFRTAIHFENFSFIFIVHGKYLVGKIAKVLMMTSAYSSSSCLFYGSARWVQAPAHFLWENFD
jgi:hypothetical protein